MEELIELVKKVFEDQWMLAFFVTWGFGYFLKEKAPKMDSDYIPLVLLVFGVVLGLGLISFTFSGALIGAVIVFAQMGFYDFAKPLVRGVTHGTKIN